MLDLVIRLSVAHHILNVQCLLTFTGVCGRF